MKLDFNSSSLRDQIRQRLHTLQDNPQKLTMWGIRLGVVVLVGAGLLMLVRPRSPQGQPTATNPSNAGQTDTTAESSAEPNSPFGAVPAQDPFQVAVDFAELAGQRAATAQTAEQWQQVVSTWDRAVRAMIAVPPKHPRYDEATEKAIEYRRNFSLVRRKAEQAAGQFDRTPETQASLGEMISTSPGLASPTPGTTNFSNPSPSSPSPNSSNPANITNPGNIGTSSPTPGATNPAQQFALASQLLDPDGRAIVDIEQVTDQIIQVTMSDEWQAQSYEARLLAARRLWEAWAKAYSPNQPDRAFLRLINTQGQRIGGSGLEGSAINVIYE